ncbi:unnamed protein product [Mycena citricolor]|uniref:CP-type G domain-containing protein n=1 Tax=Mycena citricolor TaxID=2018698 RepID=A0AAD2HJP0_9AGAR|nr:unnamed protein product [Mycena citricolor]
MPRIRKKTSNRVKINDRHKLQTRIRDSKKKKAKAAKKNPQWKSKHKKDPGIPNTFPYKDQVLAEIAEQRRLAAEDKQRKKDEKKLQKKAALESDAEGVSADEMEVDEDGAEDGGNALAEVKALGLAQGFDGIASLSAKRVSTSKVREREKSKPVVEDEEEEETPVLMNPELPNLKSVLDAADVVLQVLDARDPLPFRSSHLEELAAAKSGCKVAFVLNKIGESIRLFSSPRLRLNSILDTSPREAVAAWTTHLRTVQPTFPFRSSTRFMPLGPEAIMADKGKGKSKASPNDALGQSAILDFLADCASSKKGDAPLTVAVVGLTNSGKSSLVNSLIQKSALPIYTLATSSRGPTTTSYAQEVVLDIKGKQIRLVDTPGLAWEIPSGVSDDEDEDSANAVNDARARDILLRSKGRIDRLKDPVMAAQHIVSRTNAEDLMLMYSLPAFSAGDMDAFLSSVARAHHLVKKRGELDLTGAARIVLRDWNTGKLPRYTVPATSSAGSASLSAADESLLATLQMRRDFRKARGLVKLTLGAIETRRAVLDEDWTASAVGDDDVSEDEGEDEDEDDAGVQNDDDESIEEEAEDEEDDGEEEEEEEIVVPLSGKQKRKRAAEQAKPRKKVVFAPEPKSSKQARSAASKTPKLRDTAVKSKKIAANVGGKSQKTDGAPGPEEYNFSQFF